MVEYSPKCQLESLLIAMKCLFSLWNYSLMANFALSHQTETAQTTVEVDKYALSTVLEKIWLLLYILCHRLCDWEEATLHWNKKLAGIEQRYYIRNPSDLCQYIWGRLSNQVNRQNSSSVSKHLRYGKPPKRQIPCRIQYFFICNLFKSLYFF